MDASCTIQDNIHLSKLNIYVSRILGTHHHSIYELRLSLFEYIEGIYNLKRPHYSLKLMTRNEKELAFYEH